MAPTPSRWWLPPVAATHPGLAAVTGIWVALHVCLGLDGFIGRHTVRTWVFLGGDTGVAALGTAHLTVTAVLAAGAYTRWTLARAGFIASVTLFTLTGCLFLTAWVAQLVTGPGWTYSGPLGALNLAMAGVSAAAAREPVGGRHVVDVDRYTGTPALIVLPDTAAAAPTIPPAPPAGPARYGTDADARDRRAARAVPEQRTPVGGWATG